MKIGKYLRKYRMDYGYSQECVAEFLGVSQKTYSNMENDKSNISFETIQKLIEYYNIDISSLDVSKFISEGKLEQAFHAGDNSSVHGNTVNTISEKLIQQMEERIEELKTRVRELEAQLYKQNA